VQNSSAVDTMDKRKEGEEEGILNRGQEEGALNRGQEEGALNRGQEEGALNRGQEEGALNRGQDDVGERKPVESLAGEREHRVPNLTAPRLVDTPLFLIL
jgi:hypothetical protein